MKINNNLTQVMLKTGLCLFMLSGATFVFAQDDVSANESKETAPIVKKKLKKQVYKMKQVSGIVYDASTNKPMVGVKVQALNNAYYTSMTDEKGEYTIKVPTFVNVLYSFVEDYNGVQLAIKGDKNQNIYLYSSKLKSFYNNGTQVINSSKLKFEEVSSITIEEELENHLNSSVRVINRGGMPGLGGAMFINGLNSLNANAQPLVVVDGVIWDMQYDRTTLHQGFFNNVLTTLDVEDIDDIEVLKNGTARYGAKGANGVVIIKTKRGKSLATRINLRAYGGFETAPDEYSVMNGNQYRTYLTELFGTTEVGEKYASTMSTPFLNEDPSYVYYDLYHNNTNWQDGLSRDQSYTQNYKVNVEGGDDVAKYNLSLGYTSADATAKNNDFDRLNIRFNTDISMFRDVETALDIYYSRSATNLRDNGWEADYSQKNISSPNVLGKIQNPFVSKYAYFTVWDYETQRNKLVQSNSVYSGKTYTDDNNPFRFMEGIGTAALANPFWILSNGEGTNKNHQEQTQFSLNFAPRYTINRYLSVGDRFSYILNRSNEKYYLPYSGTPVKSVEGLGDVTSTVSSQFAKEVSIFNQFDFDFKKQFGSHFLNVNGGYRYSNFSYSTSYVQGFNNTNDKMPNLSYSLQYLTYGGVDDKWTNLSYFANVDYNFENKYFLSTSANIESSSRFGKEAKNSFKMFSVPWGFFYSAQAGWVASAESWFKIKPINYLKITAGYDVSGNDDLDYYSSRTYFQNVKFLDKATALELGNVQNPTIQWETNHRLNVGLETALFQNRLFLTANLFYNKITNLLTRRDPGYASGLSSVWTNDGEMENKGVEGSLTAVVVDTKNFKWQVSGTVGHYKNEITKLPSKITALDYSNSISKYTIDANGVASTTASEIIQGYTTSIYGDNNILTSVGNPAGVFYGYQTNGVFASDKDASTAGKYGYLRYPTGITAQPYRNFQAGDVRFKDLNGDGWISEADKTIIGDPNPDIYGNFSTRLVYKNLTLDVLFKYSLGNDVFNYERSMLEAGNNGWNQSTAMLNRWSYQGQVTDVPRIMDPSNDEWVNNERFSDRWIEDGSYLKLKKVRLTYKLPVNLNWLLGVKVWGEANNVFVASKYLGTDPEVTAGNGALYQGIDTGLLPKSRNFNLGITINL